VSEAQALWSGSLSLSVSLAPQPSLGLGLLHILLPIQSGWISCRLLNNFLFYRVGLLAPRSTLTLGHQASVFISPRGRVATHFSRLLRHAWVTVGLFLFPGHHTGRSGSLSRQIPLRDPHVTRCTCACVPLVYQLLAISTHELGSCVTLLSPAYGNGSNVCMTAFV
jgi:hypothetical protein